LTLLLVLLLPGRSWLLLLVMGRIRTLVSHGRDFVGAVVEWLTCAMLILLCDRSSNILERELVFEVFVLYEKLCNVVPFGRHCH
jgi:hypothetical protein